MLQGRANQRQLAARSADVATLIKANPALILFENRDGRKCLAGGVWRFAS
jgi:hypothetical protein